MELYKNTINEVVLQRPSSDSSLTSVQWKKNGSLQAGVLTSTLINGSYWLVKLPYITEEATIEVLWNLSVPPVGATTRTDTYYVVTPYVTVDIAREELQIPETIGNDQIERAERKARMIINRYCRQKFGKETATHYLTGKGDTVIRTPARLLTITSMTDSRSGLVLPVGSYEIRNDGRDIIKSPSYYGASDDIYLTHIIHNPYSYNHLTWKSGIEWTVLGEWGWNSVPIEVQQATLLLIENELCPDALYRERFIKTMTSADWRFEFDPSAYNSTGNLVADQLLSDYVWDGVAIL